jgi:hypothetical protein
VDDVVDVTCPHCGEPGTIAIDPDDGGGEFVQDCAVCCRPWRVRVRVRDDGSAEVSIQPEG